MSKKPIVFLAFILLLLLAAACVGTERAEPSPSPSPTAGTASPRQSAAPASVPALPTPAEKPTAAPAPSPERTDGILVVVFSATGTTRGVADRIAALTGADLKEIVPLQPYSAEDLNYNDPTSRTSAERSDPDMRPEIAEEISLDGYSTVYLGYPIWWGQAPRIVSTFVETHDFAGITVIPFCTSGSVDIGQSDDALKEQAGSGNRLPGKWLPGKRFSGGASESELQGWINDMEGEIMKKDLRLMIDGTEVPVAWERSDSVDALIDLVRSEPLAIEASAYGGFEQVGPLGTSLPQNDRQTTAAAGDIMLYSGNRIVLFYGSNSWAYTRLGRITSMTAAEITELLGGDGVTITISYGG